MAFDLQWFPTRETRIIVKAGEDFLSLGAVQGLIETEEKMERFGYNRHEGKLKGQCHYIIFCLYNELRFRSRSKVCFFYFCTGIEKLMVVTSHWMFARKVESNSFQSKMVNAYWVIN